MVKHMGQFSALSHLMEPQADPYTSLGRDDVVCLFVFRLEG